MTLAKPINKYKPPSALSIRLAPSNSKEARILTDTGPFLLSASFSRADYLR